MAARGLMASAPSSGGDVPAWSWYVPLILVVVLVAALLAYLYFFRTLMPLVHVLVGLVVGAVMVGAIVGEPQSLEIVRSRGDRGPKDFPQFIGMVALAVLLAFIANARRRGRSGGSGVGDDAGGGWDDAGD